MPDFLSNSQTIRTPEGVVFSLPLAGPLLRFYAAFLDMVCISILYSALTYVLRIFVFFSPSLFAALTIVLYFVVSIGYGICTEWFMRGQTLGKRLLRLRVMDELGLHLRFSQIIIRNLLRAVDSLPVFYAVGGLSCLLSRRCQRLGDYAAGTIVIRHVENPIPNLASLESCKYNSFHAYPHLEARLRQRISLQEAGIAVQALLRRETIEPANRIQLFKELADRYRKLAPFPEEATLGLTDEQYVHNVIESLFHSTVQSVKTA